MSPVDNYFSRDINEQGQRIEESFYSAVVSIVFSVEHVKKILRKRENLLWTDHFSNAW